MISTVLANVGRWSDLLLGVVALGFVVAAWFLVRAGDAGRRRAGLLAAAATAAALALALTPEWGGGTSTIACFVGDAVPHLGDTANIAMLLPAALLATVATRAPRPVLAATSGLSGVIELVQATAPALGRACDLNDWYTNTLGATIGVVIGGLLLLAGRRRDRSLAEALSADGVRRAR